MAVGVAGCRLWFVLRLLLLLVFTQIRETFGLVLIGPLKGGQANLPSL